MTDPMDEQLAAVNAIRGELADKMGIVLTAISPAEVTGTMPVQGNRQPFGLLHGGASAVLAETLGSFHAATAAGPDRITVGIELNCTHHRAARSGSVHGVSTPLHVGRTVSSFSIVVTDDDGNRVCTARLTCLLRSAASGAPGSQDAISSPR